MIRNTVTCLIVLILPTGMAVAHDQKSDPLFGDAFYANPNGEIVKQVNAAGKRFWDSIPPSLHDRIQYEFASEDREKWHYVPVSLLQPVGIRLGELPAGSKRTFHELMRSVLSAQGYLKSNAAMQLHDLYYYHAAKAPLEDQVGIGHYYIALFGTAGVSPWGWKVVGYHHSLEFFVSKDSVSVTPALLGSLPAEAEDTDLAGWSVLAFEKRYAEEFFQSLSDEQQAQVMQPDELPANIYYKPDVSSAPERVGLAASSLSPDQLRLLYRLIAAYLSNYRAEIADSYWSMALAENPDTLYFAWWGATSGKDARYYRIHGDRLWIEYDNPREGTSGEADPNHVHLIFRDLQNDHASQLLQEHYKNEHDQ